MKPDYVLLSIVLLLLIMGLAILGSASVFMAEKIFGDPLFFIFRQILRGLIPGLLGAFCFFKLSLERLKKWSFLLLIFNLFLLILIFIPQIGFESGGASRWLRIGPLSFQPSEFLKLTFIIYLSAWLTSANQRIFKKKSGELLLKFLPFLTILGIITILLILQPDVGTLIIIIATASFMYFMAKTPWWHSILLILLSIGVLINIVLFVPYRLERLLVFLDPTLDPLGSGFQIKQALIAIGSGGLVGRGFGMGIQKLGFLPQPIGDSIFAVFAEETGFVGSLILVILFLLFMWRGFKIAKEAKDSFSALVAVGITCHISFQAFLNIGTLIGIVPMTGIPLPFISFGGTALASSLAEVGLLLNISRQSRI